MRPSDIDERVGLGALICGNLLRHMEASKPDKKKSFCEITDTGREIAASIQAPAKIPAESVLPVASPEARIPVPPSVAPSTAVEAHAVIRTEERTTVPPVPEIPPETTPTIPSQTVLFRRDSKLLGTIARTAGRSTRNERQSRR